MFKAISLLLAATLFATPTIFAQSDIIYEQANLSGTKTTRPMKRQPPLHERGVQRIAVFCEISPVVHNSKVGMTAFNNRFQEVLDLANINSTLITKHLTDPNNSSDKLEFIDESEHYAKLHASIGISKWDGKVTLVESEYLPELLEYLSEKNYDTILYIRESSTSDFLGATNQYLGPKGYYQRLKHVRAVYATFEVRLIDIESKTGIKHASYKQGSAVKAIDIDIENDPTFESPANRDLLLSKLEETYRIASLQVLAMLKANREVDNR